MISILILSLLSSVEAYKLQESSMEPSPQTNSIFPMLPLSSHLSSSKKNHKDKNNIKVYYQSGNSEASLPVCSPNSVCNKLDTYGSPWVEKQCRCPKGSNPCSTSTHIRDGHTVTDRNRQYKICEPVKSLKKCKYFRDVTWTYIQYPDNSTQQVMHCRCPKNSVAYLTRRHAYQTVSGIGYQYSFACNPQTVSFIWNYWNIENINFSVFYYRKWSAREKSPAGYSASAKIMTDLQLMTSTQLVYVNVRIKRSVLATI